ncbi:hypothetical protein LCGC14_1817820 [marine sediment metagenome]|uniref:Uncharacterized protein n=1 Tax=marine sediment metagenome TaxID=412755 RepID=A0A0F9IZK3_9ZZZZ
MAKKKETRRITKKLRVFKIHGFTTKTKRIHYTGYRSKLKPKIYSYEFKLYKGKKWRDTLYYDAKNLRKAKKKLKTELDKNRLYSLLR